MHPILSFGVSSLLQEIPAKVKVFLVPRVSVQPQQCKLNFRVSRVSSPLTFIWPKSVGYQVDVFYDGIQQLAVSV
jgi:hypothetical protein